jgi:preprotein translocase subunit YajC
MAPFLLLLILFALAWVVLILPKQRELKRHNALVAALQVGDRVMTGSGFYGTITEIAADTVRLQLAPNLEVTVARRAVAARIDEPEAAVELDAGEGSSDDHALEPGTDDDHGADR